MGLVGRQGLAVLRGLEGALLAGSGEVLFPFAWRLHSRDSPSPTGVVALPFPVGGSFVVLVFWVYF